jgi:FdhD protein
MTDRILKTVAFTTGNGGFTRRRERIVRESALTIRLDGKPLATAMLLAAREEEFVYGHLYAQGIINSAADIAALTIKNNVAEVRLAAGHAAPPPPEKVESDLAVSKEDIFSSVRAILKSEVFAETEAVHSAGLFREGKDPVAIAEDLGRHHALDKVIGAGLLRGIDFRRTLAASTGRLPAEMISKCRHAGIPIIASKGVPTTLAIEMAVAAGITVAGLVRGDTMLVYSHPERIK